MKIIALDFETYFDDEYTLKKLTTEAYVRDPRFQVLCMGVRAPDIHADDLIWLDPDNIPRFLSLQDWSNTAVLAHHAHFDGLILSHHYGIKPCMWFDTLCMARLLVGNHVSVALSSLAAHFGLGLKTVPYDQFKGRRFENLSSELFNQLGDGCVQDVDLTYKLFRKLGRDFPVEEYKTIDMTVRMFTEPALIGDTETFQRVQMEEWSRKGQSLAELGVCEKDLQSTARFVELLRQEGVEPEFKQGKNGPIPAIAQTDDFMKGLIDHENSRVAGLASARLDAKSTINETRAGRLAGMASRGPLPCYLTYCGAHTTRWSGGDRVNFQNFPREGDLRKALSAPEGYQLAVVDLSQIECRILNYVAGQMDIVEAFATGRDLYSEGASRFYGKIINKRDNPTERHLGKVLELGCGYGMGAAKLQATCRAGALGGPAILLDNMQAQAAIKTYRDAHPLVVQYWKQGDAVLSHLCNSTGSTFMWGPLKVQKGKITLPNGAPIFYDLEYDSGERQWRRKTRKGHSPIWGGTLVENVVQAMARVVMSQAMLRIYDAGYRILLTTHDEIVVLVPEDGAQVHYEALLNEMKKTPSWLPGIPLDAEGGVAKEYSK